MNVWYMSGAGNDFLVVDARKNKFDMSKTAKELCQKYGVDGFMALDESNVADIKLHFYNSDGSRAEMCGNGARCICRFAYDNGVAGEDMQVETDAGIVFGKRISENVYRVKLNDPQDIKLCVKDCVDYTRVGVPHAFIETPNLDFNKTDELFQVARSLRFNPIFENGANVSFYSKIDENTVKILTYERGVEDFTLACGTGSGALATVLWAKGELRKGDLTVKNKGGDLVVSLLEKDGKIDALYLEGKAEVLKIFEI